MLRFRYSDWDGTQEPFAIDPDQVMDELSNDLMNDNSVWRTLQRLLQRGMTDPGGRRMEGYRDLLDRLKNRKQELTEKYDLGSILMISTSGSRTSSTPSVKGSARGWTRPGKRPEQTQRSRV